MLLAKSAFRSRWWLRMTDKQWPNVLGCWIPQQPSTSGIHLPCLTYWNQCVLCQKDTSEKLCCPAESRRSNVGSGYQTIADNLPAFSKIGCLPKTIDLSKLDDGEGIQTTFEHHKARWHDSCRLEYNKTKLFPPVITQQMSQGSTPVRV